MRIRLISLLLPVIFLIVTLTYITKNKTYIKSWSEEQVKGTENLDQVLINKYTRSECYNLYPLNDQEIQRAKEVFSDGITKEYLDQNEENSFSRAKIVNGKLYVRTYRDIFTRCYALFHFIQKAIDSSIEPIPDIEFLLHCHDYPAKGAWSITRKKGFDETWLVPDFGFWSWPEIKQMSWDRVVTKMQSVNDQWKWADKEDKLFFRGAHMDGAREHFFNEVLDKEFADVKYIAWNKDTGYKDIVTIEEHCKKKFLASLSGVTYSGRVKNLLLCDSILMMDSLDYVSHFSHLLVPDGPDQNVFVVNFGEWEATMRKFQNDVKLGKDKYLQNIIERKRAIFKDQYLTMPAFLCYWRELFHQYKSVLKFTPTVDDRDIPFEAFAIMRSVEWDMY